MKSLKKITKALSLMANYPVRPGKRLSVLFDIVSLYWGKGISFREYYNMEFEKQPTSFRDSFLGFSEERHYLQVLNPIKYYELSYNKYLTHKVLEDTGVRTAELYCLYQPDGLVCGSSEIANDVKGICRILKEKQVSSCVIKEPEGSHGSGVTVIKHIEYTDDNAVMTRFDDSTVMLSDRLKKTPLIFESLVKQTKQFADFNDSSVNTVRFMTLLHPNGDAEVIYTWIRIGRPGRCVDNAGDGGNLDARINPETGEIQFVKQFDGWRNMKEIDVHPDNGHQLNGVIIQNWNAIKEEIIRYQQAFPYCRAAGWDIAITDDGPVVLEINDRWDTTGQYFIQHGWREEIRNCYLEWKKENRDDGILRDRMRNLLPQWHLRKIESKSFNKYSE